jgi:hypothetical protein
VYEAHVGGQKKFFSLSLALYSNHYNYLLGLRSFPLHSIPSRARQLNNELNGNEKDPALQWHLKSLAMRCSSCKQCKKKIK